MRNTKKSIVHWNDIFTRTEKKAIDISNESEMTLDKFISPEYEFTKFREIIEDVTKRADNQYKLEKKLKDMEDKCKEIQLDN